MLGIWDKILVGLETVRAVVHLRKVLDLLDENSAGFDCPAPTGKADDLAKDGVNRYSDPAFGIFLAMKVQSSSTPMKEPACVSGRLSGSFSAASTNQRETSLSVHANHSADGSHPQSFGVVFVGLLFKCWIFATPQRLKDSSTSSAAIALDTSIGNIENVIWMGTVGALHR